MFIVRIIRDTQIRCVANANYLNVTADDTNGHTWALNYEHIEFCDLFCFLEIKHKCSSHFHNT
jgi:hypothetical protein